MRTIKDKREWLRLTTKLRRIIDSFHADPKKANHADELERLAFVCDSLAKNLRADS